MRPQQVSTNHQAMGALIDRYHINMSQTMTLTTVMNYPERQLRVEQFSGFSSPGPRNIESRWNSRVGRARWWPSPESPPWCNPCLRRAAGSYSCLVGCSPNLGDTPALTCLPERLLQQDRWQWRCHFFSVGFGGVILGLHEVKEMLLPMNTLKRVSVGDLRVYRRAVFN